MRTRNRNKKVISLNAKELRLLRTAMVYFRNKVISEGKPADDINELLPYSSVMGMTAKQSMPLCAEHSETTREK